MLIEKYEYTKHNCYNVYLSNGEVLTLKEEVITLNELLLKKKIDNDLYEKIKTDNTIYILFESAVKYISIRLRSIKEVKTYLLKKEKDQNIIDEVIKKLIDNKLLDDDVFTKAFIKDKIAFTNMGSYKIKMNLKNLGVDNYIIENNLSLIAPDVFEDKIKKIIEKDIKVNRKYSGINLKNKVYNHLINMGYDKEKVLSIINNYNF